MMPLYQIFLHFKVHIILTFLIKLSFLLTVLTNKLHCTSWMTAQAANELRINIEIYM